MSIDPPGTEFALERARFRFEVVKWIALSLGAIASVALIDYGRLRLERFKAQAENQRDMLQAYLSATESVEPDVWKRKLRVLMHYSQDESVRKWAAEEHRFIEDFAALDALYREALRVASQLVDAGAVNDPKRKEPRARFEQLYWADLPFAGESPEVASAMVAFRNALIAAEAQAENGEKWNDLNTNLIQLSKTLKVATRARGPTVEPAMGGGDPL